MACPCGRGASLEVCCGPVVRGKRRAKTAEELMRSRYVAYATGAIDHVIVSHDPATRASVDREFAESWSKDSEWLGLDVLGTEGGGEADAEGVVEFVARYRRGGVETAHHERASFRRDGGEWVFVDGEVQKGRPVVRQGPKVGRNDPCPCGSGKKHKKCCLAA